MSLPHVELDSADQASLRKLRDAQQGMQNFMQAMMTAGETRAAALQAQGRELFAGMATKYSIDLENVTYVPSDDGTKLIPTAVRLNRAIG